VVDERHRGHGIGSALIERVCAEAGRAGRDRVALLASTDGAPVYARCGFEEVARFGYYYRSFQNSAARGRRASS
jgi:GNAT superfamily N-acetyltransferase